MIPGFAGMPMGYMVPGYPVHMGNATSIYRPPVPAAVTRPRFRETEKATTVFVGKIPEGVDNALVLELLEQCDRVVHWNRKEDEHTRKWPLFGFCEFESAQGVWRALSFLQGRRVGDGQEMLIKFEDKVQVYLDVWKKMKQKELSLQAGRLVAWDQVDALLRKDCADAQAEIDRIFSAMAEVKKAPVPVKPVEVRDVGRAELTAEDRRRREELSKFRSSFRERSRIDRWLVSEREADREYQRRLLAWERDEERRAAEYRVIGVTLGKLDVKKTIARDLTARTDAPAMEERVRQRRREREDEDKDREEARREFRRRRDREQREREVLEREEERRHREVEEERQAREARRRSDAEKEAPAKLSFRLPEAAPADPDPAPKAAPDRAKKLEDTKALIARIPTAREDIFAFKIDWAIMKAESIVEKKLRPWVRKKVIEYLGAEEEGMIDYIINKVNSCSSPCSGSPVTPHSLLADLKEFLDDDAEGFVVKMWRMNIFEFLRVMNR